MHSQALPQSKWNQNRHNRSININKNQVDINHLIEDDFDINNSILADEPMELEQEQEYCDNKQREEYQDAMQFAMEQIEEG